MSITLRKLRTIITTELFSGIEPDDSKLNNKYYNQLIFDVRATVCVDMYKSTKTIDPAWYSTIPLVVNRISNNSGISYQSDLPTIIYLDGDIGINIRGGIDYDEMEYLEKVSMIRATTLRKNVYDSGKSKFCRIGNKAIYIKTNRPIVAVAEAIVYDLFSIPSFTEDTPMPVCSEGVKLIQQRIQELDIKMLQNGAKDNKNNSVLSLQTPKKQEE